MLTQAALVKFIIAAAQPVAAAHEVDRLTYVCEHHWKGWQDACKAKDAVDPKAMPKPSTAWINAAAAEIIAAPLFPGDPKREVVHMLVYAMGESAYRDDAVGDGGKSFCSLGVMVGYGASAEDLLQKPAVCVRVSRLVMRSSFRCWPDHPMACYAGWHNSNAARIADARARLVGALVETLPGLEDVAGVAGDGVVRTD